MEMALTQQDLKHLGCGAPQCSHDHSVLFLHARCHMQAGVEASYKKETGTLLIVCARCKKAVGEFLVSPC
jgi:hypothetical protein